MMGRRCHTVAADTEEDGLSKARIAGKSARNDPTFAEDDVNERREAYGEIVVIARYQWDREANHPDREQR